MAEGDHNQTSRAPPKTIEPFSHPVVSGEDDLDLHDAALLVRLENRVAGIFLPIEVRALFFGLKNGFNAQAKGGSDHWTETIVHVRVPRSEKHVIMIASAVKPQQSTYHPNGTHLLWVPAYPMPASNTVRLQVVSIPEQFAPVVGVQVRPLSGPVPCCCTRNCAENIRNINRRARSASTKKLCGSGCVLHSTVNHNGTEFFSSDNKRSTGGDMLFIYLLFSRSLFGLCPRSQHYVFASETANNLFWGKLYIAV